MLVNIHPRPYQKYVVIENGVNVLYVKLKRYSYGLLQSALPYYLKLVTDLKNNSFSLNIYEPCVANKLVNREIMILVWHVDGIKVSHKESLESTTFSIYLSTMYGKKLLFHRGKVHAYLGMNLEYSYQEVVKLLMVKYLHKMQKNSQNI